MICAAVIYYRADLKDLQRLCDSLVGRVDCAVFVDGPFEGVSKDVKTIRAERDILGSFRNRVPSYISVAHVFPDEAAKRTFAARLAYESFNTASHLLVIDSDEELLTRVPIPEPSRLGVARIIDRNHVDGGATMIRLHELTPDITWGPSHFEVMNHGLRYSTPFCRPELPHSFKIAHHSHPVKEHEGYEQYNKKIRPTVEGRHRRPPEVMPSWVYESREDTIYGGRV